MSLYVKKAGLLDTIQDCGRFGFRRFGINTSGAMDVVALKTGNLVLGNAECEAGLEMHFPAPVFEFRSRAIFALTGADFGARLNSESIASNTAHFAETKDVLEFTKYNWGQRCYLTFRNGFEIDTWLGSKSTNLAAEISGYKGRRIARGDLLSLGASEVAAPLFPAAAEFRRAARVRLRFVPGPAFHDLTAVSMLALSTRKFAVRNNSNRMGYRLKGPPLHLLDSGERISSAVTFGTIQLLPDNQLIVLMADHQTTGGYPNIGTITGRDLSVAAQLGAGDTFTLEAVTVAEAENIEREADREMAFLKAGLRLRGAWNS